MQVNLTPQADRPPPLPGYLLAPPHWGLSSPRLQVLGVRESRGSPRGASSPGRRGEKSKGKEFTADGTGTRVGLLRTRVLLRARRFSPKNLELAEDTYIQETMNSYLHAHAHLVKKKKRKETKTGLLSSPRSLNKESRQEWGENGGAGDAEGGVPAVLPFLLGLLRPQLPMSVRGVGAETGQSHPEHLDPKDPSAGQLSATLSC